LKESKWRQLSRVDVSHGIERKGNLDYLSWPVAWSSLMDAYPDSTYQWLDPITLPDGTMMVRCCVTVDDITHEMQLPVLDHRNKPIANPNAFDFNSAQMRCLVKAIALHGIGISLYLGKMSDVVSVSKFERAQELIDSGDYIEFHQFVKGLSEQEQVDVFNGAPAGKKTEFKSAWRALLAQAESYFTEVQQAIEEAVANEDTLMLEETLSECSTYERKAVWERLGGEAQQLVKQMRSAA
jgi:hypothetical protein